MDKITHEVRIANWKTIVEQCNNRPEGVSVKQWLAENNVNEKLITTGYDVFVRKRIRKCSRNYRH